VGSSLRACLKVHVLLATHPVVLFPLGERRLQTREIALSNLRDGVETSPASHCHRRPAVPVEVMQRNTLDFNLQSFVGEFSLAAFQIFGPCRFMPVQVCDHALSSPTPVLGGSESMYQTHLDPIPLGSAVLKHHAAACDGRDLAAMRVASRDPFFSDIQCCSKKDSHHDPTYSNLPHGYWQCPP
jgi:hypothetical protein